MGKVIILQGFPGSGKSTVAKQYPGAYVISADNFFMKEGKYSFEPDKIGLAHQECFRSFIYAIMKDEATIIVDNTNLHASEISPYYLAAESYGYEVEVLRIDCDPDSAFKRQQHEVPSHAFDYMVRDFNRRDVLPWWNVQYYMNDKEVKS